MCCALGLSLPDCAWMGAGPDVPGTGLGRSFTPMAALCPGSLPGPEAAQL